MRPTEHYIPEQIVQTIFCGVSTLFVKSTQAESYAMDGHKKRIFGNLILVRIREEFVDGWHDLRGPVANKLPKAVL